MNEHNWYWDAFILVSCSLGHIERPDVSPLFDVTRIIILCTQMKCISVPNARSPIITKCILPWSDELERDQVKARRSVRIEALSV